jgi:hypothetical protein
MIRRQYFEPSEAEHQALLEQEISQGITPNDLIASIGTVA